MKKILMSAGMIVFVGAIVAGATGAFFSDTETSSGNTFTAGALDLRVDSQAHYNGHECIESDGDGPEFVWGPGEATWPITGTPCDGTWAETDLGAETVFFNLTDIKPGDEGENTISLHVYSNDAWGRFVIDNVEDVDNDCTEPEEESELDSCTVEVPELQTPNSGELAESVSFYAWIDDGATPGFQGLEDAGEGDNVQQQNEQTIITPGTVDEAGETHDIWPALAAYRDLLDGAEACEATDADGNGQTDNDGTPSEDDYVACQGIADDGRMVGSTTYYFGLAWSVPDTVGNEAQTDALNADLSFEVEQHRANETPFTI